MGLEVGKGFRLIVGAAVLASVLAQPSQEPTRVPRPATYPIAADAEAERTHLSQSFSVTWIHDASSPDAPSLRDRDGNGVPDSVEALLGSFEAARSFLLGELGYRPPPVGGPSRIYITGREDHAVTRLAPGEGRSRQSFTIVSTSALRGRSPRSLRVLAVHEYFHAIQNGYDSDYDPWFGEASATWVQDVFDDGLDSNHHHLRAFVPFPRRSLTDIQGDHEYGAFLFVQFLVERYGGGRPGIVREIWEQMAAPEAAGQPQAGSLDAIEAALARRATTFEQAWAEFQLWRWDLDRFEEGQAYKDALGKQWPKPLQSTQVGTESCRLSSDAPAGLPPLSGDYSVFRPADRPDTAKATLTVEGQPGATGFALVQGAGGRERVHLLEIGADGLASAAVRFGDDQVKRVILGVGNPARDGPAAGFGYSLRILGRSAVQVAPVEPPAEAHLFGGLTLRGRVLCGGQPAPLADVVLVQDKRSGERRTFPLTTAAGGTWSRTFEPEQTSTYHVEVTDPLLSRAASPSWDVAVRVALLLEVPDPEVALGEPARFQGEVGPPHPGALVLIEYRRPDLSWRAGPQVTARGDGTFEGTLTLPASGIWELRAIVTSTGDDDHIGNTTVNDVLVNVR